MKDNFPNIKQKADSSACGPSCLQAIYKYYGKDLKLKMILEDLHIDKDTSTYVSQLARHLNTNHLSTTLISSNPFVVSPDWKAKPKKVVIKELKEWILHHFNKGKVENIWIKEALYLLFYLQEGGNLKISNITTDLIDKYLEDQNLILCCLAENWIWGKRKISKVVEYDNIKGHVNGHFVIVYDKNKGDYQISDPYPTSIENKEGLYAINKEELLTATLTWSHEILIVNNIK
ncbi:hypothetical protein GF362_01395 [Candidatus Dojkabacteria bacterium]|nr:hypothetical protein [Candidatus Dojkabacteria bacterium]